MPRPPKLRPDVNEIAYRTIRAATGEAEKPKPAGEGEANPTAAIRGRKGGKRGGKVRAAKLSAKRRSEIARRAARARWKD